MAALAGLLDLVVPARCAACGAGEILLCAACRASLAPLRPPLCMCCGAPVAWPVERCRECTGRQHAFRTARAALAYEGTARRLVTVWKERGLRSIAAEAAELVVSAVPAPEADALVFVPGDSGRTLWRGHNTAEALARELAARWRLPVAAPLGRARRSPRQRGLSRAARRTNVRGSFRVREPVPARVVLVDDVYTTGATAAAAATELRRGGARTVDVVSFARALRGR